MEALSRIFLDNLNPCRYEELMWGIKNLYSEGWDIYPANVAEAVVHV